MLPTLFIMPIGGVLGDYFNKKRIIQIGEIINVALVGSLIATPFSAGHMTAILLLHFSLNAVVAIHHPIFQAIIPAVVPQEKIKNFNAYVTMLGYLPSLVAPALIGMWIGIGGTVKTLLYCLVAGYIFSLLLISLVKYTHQPPSQKLGLSMLFTSLYQGFQYIFTHPFFRNAVALFFFVNFGETCINSNLLYYLRNHYGISEASISYYYLPVGVGSLLGALLALYIMGRMNVGKIIVYCSALAGLCIGLMLTTINPLVCMSLWGLNTAGIAVIVVAYFTARQQIVPPHLLSRVVATTRMIAYLAIPLASLSSGWLFEQTESFSYLIIISSLTICLAALRFGRSIKRFPIQDS